MLIDDAAVSCSNKFQVFLLETTHHECQYQEKKKVTL